MRRRCDLLDRQVIACSHRGQNSESRRGDTQPSVPKALGVEFWRVVQDVRYPSEYSTIWNNSAKLLRTYS
jgi:hypothetical protein